MKQFNRNRACWAICAICLAASAARAQVVAYYRFESGMANVAAGGNNTVLDSSGTALNGTPIGGPVYRQDVRDNPIPRTGATNALSLGFTGSNYVTIADAPHFQLTHSLTIEAYIKPQSFQSGEHQIFFRGDSRSFLDPYLLMMVGDQIVMRIGNASNQNVEISATLPTAGQWYHVAGTLDDATGALRMYVNGTLMNSTTTTIRPFAVLDAGSDPQVDIGSYQSGGAFFTGLIDEVRLSATALPPTQFLAVPEPSSLLPALVGTVSIIRGIRRLRFRVAKDSRRCVYRPW